MPESERCGGTGTYAIYAGDGSVVESGPCPGCPDCRPCERCTGDPDLWETRTQAPCPRCHGTGVEPAPSEQERHSPPFTDPERRIVTIWRPILASGYGEWKVGEPPPDVDIYQVVDLVEANRGRPLTAEEQRTGIIQPQPPPPEQGREQSSEGDDPLAPAARAEAGKEDADGAGRLTSTPVEWPWAAAYVLRP